jgi:hypothetical protein
MSSPKQKPLHPTAERLEGDGLGGFASATVSGAMEKKSSSTWFALRTCE